MVDVCEVIGMAVVWAEVVTEVVGRLFSWLPSSPVWLAVWGSHFEYAVLSSPSQVKVVVSAWPWMSFVPVVATCSTWLGRPTAFPPSVADTWLVARLRSPGVSLSACRNSYIVELSAYRNFHTVELSGCRWLQQQCCVVHCCSPFWLPVSDYTVVSHAKRIFCFRYFSFDRLDRPTDLDLLIALDFKPATLSLTVLTFYRCTCWYFVFCLPNEVVFLLQ
jgi:hypothetical protein